MVPSLQRKKIRHPIAIILVTFSVFLLPKLIEPTKALSAPAQGSEVTDKVRMVKLYTIHQGKALNRILDPAVLLRQEPIEVEGYVTGVLILADVQMSIKVDGQTMSKIRKNSDGTYSIKYLGKVGSNEIGITPSNTYYKKGRDEHGRMNFLEGYSLFPKVVGDAVSPASSFQIAVEIGDTSCTLPIEQKGYNTFHVAQVDPIEGENPIEFQYLGEKLDKHMQVQDFQERIRAVSSGIRAVEKTFGADLVRRVKILDYEKVQNAVTCEEKTDIWFYVNTFLREPLDELKTIAEHEALHILVDQRNLAKDLEVRELFSDLKGFDTLSRERFSVITRGASPAFGSDGDAAQREFFAFIDEKNFLEGMKGGHSSQNVDEFCTSFLHSLMFVDRLQTNLERPLNMGAGNPGRRLQDWERQRILGNYLRTLETLLGALAEETGFDRGTPSFLKSCLNQVCAVQII